MKNAALLIAIVLVVAACGGSDAEPDDDSTTTVAQTEVDDTTTSAASADAGTTATTEPAGTSDAGMTMASVTVEGETYLFGDTGVAVQCSPDLFGIFAAVLRMVDENGDEVAGGGVMEVTLLREGTDPDAVGQENSVRVSISDLDQDWIAFEPDVEALELDAGTSQVDSHTIEGNTASGTATFYEENSYFAFAGGTADSVTVAQGTFEVTCAAS